MNTPFEPQLAHTIHNTSMCQSVQFVKAKMGQHVSLFLHSQHIYHMIWPSLDKMYSMEIIYNKSNLYACNCSAAITISAKENEVEIGKLCLAQLFHRLPS